MIRQILGVFSHNLKKNGASSSISKTVCHILTIKSEHEAAWQLVTHFSLKIKSQGCIVKVFKSASPLLMKVTLTFFNNFVEILAILSVFQQNSVHEF